MDNVYMPLQLAPASLSQPILPDWQFHLFNVNLGTSSNPVGGAGGAGEGGQLYGRRSATWPRRWS